MFLIFVVDVVELWSFELLSEFVVGVVKNEVVDVGELD